MLKGLNRHWVLSRCRAAAWRRWYRKLPHNRVRRPRIRDAEGRPIGYGQPEPLPEPAVPIAFCQTIVLPSGRVELVLDDSGVEAAYRIARHPSATAEEVKSLPLTEEAIRKLFQTYCCQ
jgi:hypothetical protein